MLLIIIAITHIAKVQLNIAILKFFLSKNLFLKQLVIFIDLNLGNLLFGYDCIFRNNFNSKGLSHEIANKCALKLYLSHFLSLKSDLIKKTIPHHRLKCPRSFQINICSTQCTFEFSIINSLLFHIIFSRCCSFNDTAIQCYF